MKKKEIISALIKCADELDKNGFYKAANQVTGFSRGKMFLNLL